MLHVAFPFTLRLFVSKVLLMMLPELMLLVAMLEDVIVDVLRALVLRVAVVMLVVKMLLL